LNNLLIENQTKNQLFLQLKYYKPNTKKPIKMKKIKSLLLTVLVAMTVQSVSAQCVISSTIPDSSGFQPDWTELPCAVRGQQYDETIYFKNFENAVLTYLRVDNISRQPAGLNWQMSVPAANAANTLKSGERGCIGVSGITNAPAGVYKLFLEACVKVTISPNEICDSVDGLINTFIGLGQLPAGTVFEYKLVVIEPGETCPNVSTGVKELNSVSSFEIYPNPFSSNAQVSFTSSVKGVLTAKLTDVIGREVYMEKINAQVGSNSIELNKNGLSTGVYIFTLSDGKESMTRRVVIE
jgi:hypothetical protein